MATQPISKSSRIAVGLITAILVMSAAWMVRHRSAPVHQTPVATGVDAAKQARLTARAPAAEAKATNGFSLALAASDLETGGALQSTSRLVRLSVTLKAEQPMSGHEFNWILPAGYVVTDGAAAGILPTLAPTQTHTLSVVVNRGSFAAQPVVLHVFRLVKAEPIGQVAQFDFPMAESRSGASTAPAVKIAPGQRYMQ